METPYKKTDDGRYVCRYCNKEYRYSDDHYGWIPVCNCDQRSDLKNWEVDKLNYKIEELKRQLTMQSDRNHQRNVELDALRYVWCDGGCPGGVHRWTPGEFTDEIIEAAIRNTNRMIRYHGNKKFRELRRKNEIEKS